MCTSIALDLTQEEILAYGSAEEALCGWPVGSPIMVKREAREHGFVICTWYEPDPELVELCTVWLRLYHRVHPDAAKGRPHHLPIRFDSRVRDTAMAWRALDDEIDRIYRNG